MLTAIRQYIAGLREPGTVTLNMNHQDNYDVLNADSSLTHLTHMLSELPDEDETVFSLPDL